MVNKIASILVIIGAINWGTVGLLEFDMIGSLFGGTYFWTSKLIYVLIGIAGLYCAYLIFDDYNNRI
ncbi:MAG: DUF378 domain-containing protein [Paraclostridium sp.]